MADIFTQGPVDGILDNLAVLLATANRDALEDNPRRSVTDNARNALCKALGIRMISTVDDIKAALAAALVSGDIHKVEGAGHE